MLAVAVLSAVASAGRAGDLDQLHADLREFFSISDAERRAQIAVRIEQNAAYNPATLGGALHAAGLFEPQAPGLRELQLEIADGSRVSVSMRIPKAYDPAKKYPLIYALHGSGGHGRNIIRFVEQAVGEEGIEEFIVAAPNGYQAFHCFVSEQPTDEHRRILTAIKRAVHVDSDRVYAIGYSRGGHACWRLAVTMPGEFAAIIPVAGTLLLQDYDQTFEAFLPNIAATRVYCCWGANDTASADMRTASAAGGIAGLNRKLEEMAAELELPLQTKVFESLGHSGVMPERETLRALLRETRRGVPSERQEHTARGLRSARNPWVVGTEWLGKRMWDSEMQVTFRAGEDPRAALGRAIRQRLGSVAISREGNAIDVRRKRLKTVRIWLPAGIEWSEAVTVRVSGRKVFDEVASRRLLLCLTQAAETYDFDRLRWFGLEYRSGRKVQVVE